MCDPDKRKEVEKAALEIIEGVKKNGVMPGRTSDKRRAAPCCRSDFRTGHGAGEASDPRLELVADEETTNFSKDYPRCHRQGDQRICRRGERRNICAKKPIERERR